MTERIIKNNREKAKKIQGQEKFLLPSFLFCFLFDEFLESVDEIFGEIRNCLTPSFPRTGEFFEFPKMNRYRYKNESTKKNFWYFWLQTYGDCISKTKKIPTRVGTLGDKKLQGRGFLSILVMPSAVILPPPPIFPHNVGINVFFMIFSLSDFFTSPIYHQGARGLTLSDISPERSVEWLYGERERSQGKSRKYDSIFAFSHLLWQDSMSSLHTTNLSLWTILSSSPDSVYFWYVLLSLSTASTIQRTLSHQSSTPTRSPRRRRSCSQHFLTSWV